MLFNKSTGKPDVLSNKSLIAWLEQKPANQRYSYTDTQGCVLHQYFTENGYRGVRVMPHLYTYAGRLPFVGYKKLPSGWERVAKGSDWDDNWTFGQALQRAKALEDA